MNPRIGLVIRVDSKVCWVRLPEGALLKCPIRGRLFQADTAARNPVAVGDQVEVQSGEADDQGRIEAVLPRQSKLSRPVADSAGRREQVIVANVDGLAVVVAAARPPLRPGLIDRYLIAAARQELTPLVVVNKIDLADETAIRDELSLYTDLGISLVFTSALTGAGLEDLRTRLAGQRTVLAGHSGVGKSSLLNALLPDLELPTRLVNRRSGRGVHTTTQVTWIDLPQGGAVIDTPGVRAMGLWQVDPGDVDAYFDEITEHTPSCRFRGCSHQHEPNCAVKAAVESGAVDRRRYESYLRIVASLEEEQRERGR